MNSVELMGVRVDVVTPGAFSAKIEELLLGNAQNAVSKVNTEFLSRALDSTAFSDVLAASALNIADGRGVLWVGRYLTLPITGNRFLRPVQAVLQMIASGAAIVLRPSYICDPLPANIPGTEAFHLMLEAARATGRSVFIFGAEEIVLRSAVAAISRTYPDLRIAGSLSGYGHEGTEVVQAVNATDAALLIVALGSPKQEYWIAENLAMMPGVRVAVGEGGTLDFIAGDAKLAPATMRRMGLEWLWRLVMNRSKSETGSRARRVWNAVPVFITRVVGYKIRNGATVLEGGSR